MSKEKLLRSNTKLEKGGDVFDITGLTLAPHTKGGKGNVCAFASDACIEACNLWMSGHMVTDVVRNAMIRRTEWFFKDRKSFIQALLVEIKKVEAKASKMLDVNFGIRLNTASDIDWSLMAPQLFTAAPTVGFYDYTKDIKKAERFAKGNRPSNYEVTYSFSERSDVDRTLNLLRSGGNVAVVFDTVYRPGGKTPRIDALPKKWKRFTIVDGDQHDYRHHRFDGKGVVVGLRGKGGSNVVRKGVEGGFIQPTKGGVMDLLAA
jgi:hypothetical protein